MSRTNRTRTPTFRFNRNDDDLLEEVLESNESLHGLSDETLESLNDSLTSSTTSPGTDANASPSLRGSGATRERPSVKDFIASRLNKTKSLDEEKDKESSIKPNWFDEMKVKIKEKIDERKREREREKLLNNSDTSEAKPIESDVQSRDSSKRNSFSTKNSEINDTESLKTDTVSELSIDCENQSTHSDIPPLASKPNLEIIDCDFFEIKNTSEPEESIDENNESNEYSFMPDLTKPPATWTYSQLFNTCALIIALISLIISVSLPINRWFSGFLYGIVATFILFAVILFYFISNYVVMKPRKRRESSKKELLTIDIANPIAHNEEIFKGWVYEFAGSYEERDHGFRVQLIYVRLQGSSLRLSKPKHDIKKSKLKSNSLPIFSSQRFFDISKMTHKKVYLLLPKSVKNQKKYIWSKKYPICLELEDLKSKSINKLILFVRNCRDKEEWFWKLREVIHQSVYAPTGTSGPPTPSSASDVISSEIESLPRTHSLDLGSLQSATTCSSASSTPSSPKRELLIMSKQLDYNLFMNKIMAFKTQNTSSLLWFNALISRICFDILNEQFWSNYIAAKIQRKLRRLRLPYFMESLTITEIDLGNTLPKFNDVPNPPVVDKRGLWIDFDITYSGGFTMTLETKLNLMKLKEQANGQEMKNFVEKSELDLSDNESDSIITSSDEEVEEKPSIDPDDADSNKKQQKLLKFVDKIASSQYFQKATENKYIKRAMEGVSKTALILTVQIQTLNGTLALNIPEPPTDRLWYGFRGNPDLVLSARPKLGEHEVSISHVTDIIERKLRSEFNKVLVMPNMDDLVIPVMMTNVDQFITVVP